MKRMRHVRFLRLILVAVALTCSQISYATLPPAKLTLTEAEHLAISTAPELKQLQANTDSLEQQAVADGQLSDPQLVAGIANLPTNPPNLTQDDMTMIQVGVQQTFAPGHSLAMKSKKTEALARAEQQKIPEQTSMLLWNVRKTWLDLYYWKEAAVIIHENKLLYGRLLKVSESEYSTGKTSQSDVLQVRVALSRLNDQSEEIDQQVDVLQAQLGRLIGEDEADRPLSATLPNWPNPPPLNILQAQLLQHPLLKVDAEDVDAARDEVAFSKEQYKPGWTVGVGYAQRQGNMADGSPRSSYVNAQLTVDLPFFTANRQTRRLHASEDQLTSAELDRDMHYRDLVKELSEQYETWQILSKREVLYKKHLTLEAKQSSKAALLAYKNTTTDLASVLRAYSNQLTIRLDQIQIQVNRAKAQAALLYLEGVTQ
jgi:outer membrane protein TolC